MKFKRRTNLCHLTANLFRLLCKGKTVTALTAIGMLMRARRIDNALVVGPKTVAENWLGEAKTWLEPMVPGVQVHLVRCKSGTTKKDPNPRKLLQRALDPVQRTYVQRIVPDARVQSQNSNHLCFFFCIILFPSLENRRVGRF